MSSPRGTPEFVHDEKTRFSPEELVAQLFAKAKDFAEISHGECTCQLFLYTFLKFYCSLLLIPLKLINIIDKINASGRFMIHQLKK